MLGTSSGRFLWAMLWVMLLVVFLAMFLVMLVVLLSAVLLWASGDVLGGAPVAFMALPGDAPGYLPSGGDLVVPHWGLPLGTSSGCFLWAMLLVMCLAMLLAMLLAALLRAFLALPSNAPGDFLPAETSWSHVGRFLWVLPLGASSGQCSW